MYALRLPFDTKKKIATLNCSDFSISRDWAQSHWVLCLYLSWYCLDLQKVKCLPDKELNDTCTLSQNLQKVTESLLKNRVCHLGDTHARCKIGFKVPFHCRNFPRLLPLLRVLSAALQLHYWPLVISVLRSSFRDFWTTKYLGRYSHMIKNLSSLFQFVCSPFSMFTDSSETLRVDRL